MRKFFMPFLLVLLLSACHTPPMISNFQATPANLPAGGGSVKLEWGVSDADSLSLDQGIGVVSGTSTTFNVNTSKTFTLTATNTSGSTTASVGVAVETSALTISPASLTLTAGSPAQTFSTTANNGGTITWSLNPAVGAGSINATTGTSTVYTPPSSVSITTTATLTATLEGSSAVAHANITLNPAPPSSGSLQVNISGLPSGLAGNVSIAGPNGFTRTLVASENLSALTPGSYTLSPASVSKLATYTDSIFNSSATTAMVSAGKTATVEIAYAPLPGSGKLWIAFNYSIAAYDESQLTSGTTQPPLIAFGGGDIGLLKALAFDKAGNLWISDGNYCHLSRFAAQDLGKIGKVTPDVVIGNGRTCAVDKISSPQGLAFDNRGNLWVAEYGSAALTMYSAAQLTSSGDPTPLKITSTALKNPICLAFDSSGILWVSNPAAHNVLMFAPDKLATGGVLTPTRTLETPAFSAPSGAGLPAGLAFDKNGDLWVSNNTNKTLLMFTPSKLQAGGTQTPDKSVSPNVSTPNASGPGSLTLDKAGNLWVTYGSNAANIADHKIVRINASDLTDGAAPKPAAELNGYQYISLGGLAFYPIPAGLPIN